MNKILFIGLDYYHYPKVISDAFSAREYAVEFYPIEPRTNFFKVARYAFPNVYRKSLDQYHSELIELTSGVAYDVVFFITAHFMSDENFEVLRSSQKNATFIAYHWDSVSQYDFLSKNQFFDKVYSFDREDCERYKLDYLPLFAAGAYSENLNCESLYDVYTVASVVRPERYILIDKFRSWCKKNDITYCFYIKVTLVSYFRLILRGVLPRGVFFRGISSSEMKDLAKISRCALDVTNNKQSGLTMRVIENIYSRKKVVTTNENVVKEGFFDDRQVFLWDKNTYIGMSNFLKNDVDIGDTPELSIECWAGKILDL